MKSRDSFVSNSSSTSFILAFKNNPKCKHCGRSDPDLADLMEALDRYDYSDRTHIKKIIKNNILHIYK